MKRLRSFVREARHRHVFRVAGIYIVAAWVVVQVADTTFPGIDIPDAAIRYVWFAVILGFPLALIFGWRYDITAKGLRRTPPAHADETVELPLRRPDFVILALLVFVAAGVVYQLTSQLSDSRSGHLVSIADREIDPLSIAILPLDNLSDTPEQAYFVEGMHEALIASLSRVRGLTVISRTSTKIFAESQLPLPEIARLLGVAKIIEGSVYKVGDRIRITLQLIDAESDAHLWAENYERELQNVLQMQGDVSRDIAQAVRIRLTQDETALFARSGETNPQAYEAYLRGRFHGSRFTPQDMKLAEEYFRSALEIEPDYALAFKGLAQNWAQRIVSGTVPPSLGGPEWLAVAQKAKQLDPDSAEAQSALAAVMAWYAWDWQAAEQAYQRAIKLNPNLAEARVFYSHFLTAMGNYAEAEVQISRALELDPLNTYHRALRGAQLGLAGRSREAVALFRELYERDPGMGFGYIPYQSALFETGHYEEAYAAAKTRWTIFGDTEAVHALDLGYEQGGFAGAMLKLAELLEARSNSRYVGGMRIAAAFDYGGNPEKAIEWLQRAYESRNPNMVYLSVIPYSDVVRSDARFAALLRRLNLPQNPGE